MSRKRARIAWSVWIAARQNDYVADSILGVFWTEEAAKAAAGEDGYVEASEILALTWHLTPDTAEWDSMLAPASAPKATRR